MNTEIMMKRFGMALGAAAALMVLSGCASDGYYGGGYGYNGSGGYGYGYGYNGGSGYGQSYGRGYGGYDRNYYQRRDRYGYDRGRYDYRR